MAQPQEINHIIINDTLYLKHFCTKSTENYKKWETILYNSKSGKQLLINEFETHHYPVFLKTNKYVQVFHAVLYNTKLYTLIYSCGFIMVGCDEFDSPNTFKGTTYPITNYKLHSYSKSPLCHGKILLIDDELYTYLHIAEPRSVGRPEITGIFKLVQGKGLYDIITPLVEMQNIIGVSQGNKVYQKLKKDWPKPDTIVTDKIYYGKDTFDNIDLDKDKQFVADTIRELVIHYLGYNHFDTFEYFGYLTNEVPSNIGQHYKSVFFFYKINGKVNYVEYVKQMNKVAQFWLSKEMILSPVEYTNEITQMYGK